MRLCKRCTAIVLSIATLFTLFSFRIAAAEVPENASEPVYIWQDDNLSAIDFSGAVRDLSTVYTGNVEVYITDDEDVRSRARFFIEDGKCLLVFGIPMEDGSFYRDPIRPNGIDFAYLLRAAAEGEMLFDDTASFLFFLHDALKDLEEDEIGLSYPHISVAECEGETVKKLAVSFVPKWTREPLLLDCADLEQVLTLEVNLFFAKRTYYCIPLSFDPSDGTLIVSLRDAQDSDREGVLLHNLGIEMEDGTQFESYSFTMSIPQGLLYRSGDRKLCNSAMTGYDIEGLPFRVIFTCRVPTLLKPLDSFLERKIEELSIFDFVSVLALMIPYWLIRLPAFPILHEIHAYRKSFADYGFGFDVLIRGFLKNAWALLRL